MRPTIKIAIIGASYGQLPLCLKAKEMGLLTICFAWEKGAICKPYVDIFYPISITEKDRILSICREIGINGIISNASDLTADTVSYVATNLGLHGLNYENFISISDKYKVRKLTENIPGLSSVSCHSVQQTNFISFPCVVKPVTGCSKKGVVFVENKESLQDAISYARSESECDIVAEDFIQGHEVSVETLSFEGKHHIIQITDKENSGAPHFVEIAHHQPSMIGKSIKDRIKQIIPIVLDRVGFSNGAAHIEMIIKGQQIYLIEINPRGGGDEISNTLVQLSTGYDYVKGMIEISIGYFNKPEVHNICHAGILFLCEQTRNLLPIFLENKFDGIIVKKQFDPSIELNIATGNYDRNGYLIYKSDKPYQEPKYGRNN